MTQAGQGDRVKVHYTGKLSDGTVFDSSEGGPTLDFTLGDREVIDGFDQAVTGMTPGEEKTVTIPAAQAYGQGREELIAAVPRDQFPDEIKPEPGMTLQMIMPDGSPIPVVVREVRDDSVVLDANHPLAGQDLTFTIRLEAIETPAA